MRRAAWLMFLFFPSLAMAQAPPRDVRRPEAGGAARIVGTIRSADTPGRPLRRARVTLNGDALPVGRTVIADDNGAFTFDALPTGLYVVAAVKEGYVRTVFGARRPERPGRSILLRRGETRTVALRLQRGAVITGTVLDPDGQPAPNIPVIALTSRYVPSAGERRLVNAGSSATDDRGVYRIFGLVPGEYAVSAAARLPLDAEVQVLSESEVKRALAALRESPAARSRPGVPVAPPPLAPPEPRRTLALVPVFYPGTTVAARAGSIALAAAEERSGIDFQLEYVPTATVAGLTSEPAAVTLVPAAQPGLPINASRATRAGADGRFSFAGVAPGEFTVIASVVPIGSTPRSAGTPALSRAAFSTIFVSGDDVMGVALALQPGLRISGRLMFEGKTPPPPDMPGVRLTIPATMPLGSTTVRFPPLQLDGDGRFNIAGIVPGAYRLGGNVPGIRTPLGHWWLRSVAVNGAEVLDSLIELREDRADAIVTLSDRASELTGRVTDANGNAWVDGYVVIFSTDRRTWFLNSRRVAGARPNSEGHYTVRNLPAGDYFVLAYDDVEIAEWFDPSLLEQLAPLAARIRIEDYERKTHDVVVR